MSEYQMLLKHYNAPKYGVSFNESTGVGTRLYSAAGKQFQRSSLTDPGVDDFHGKGPFDIKQCSVLWNPTTQKHDIIYKGEPGYSDTRGDIMIDFPLFYFSRPSYLTFVVSDKPFKDSRPSPMHYRDGHLYKHCYVSKYMANSSYLSRSGNTILCNKTIKEFREGFWNANHTYVQDAAVIFSLNMLRMVKYASLDSQGTIGYGWVNSSHTNTVQTGHNSADNILSMDGGTGAITNQDQAIVSLGIEDAWGNVWEFVDGFIQKDSVVYYSNSLNKNNYDSSYTLESQFTEYNKIDTRCATTVYTTNGYNCGAIKTWAYDSIYPELLFPSESIYYNWVTLRDGAYNDTIFHDGYWYNTGDWKLLLIGGCYSDSLASGFCAFYMNTDLSFAYKSFCSRSFLVA